MPPVGHLVFKTSEALLKCLVGSTPTSSAINLLFLYIYQNFRIIYRTLTHTAYHTFAFLRQPGTHLRKDCSSLFLDG